MGFLNLIMWWVIVQITESGQFESITKYIHRINSFSHNITSINTEKKPCKNCWNFQVDCVCHRGEICVRCPPKTLVRRFLRTSEEEMVLKFSQTSDGLFDNYSGNYGGIIVELGGLAISGSSHPNIDSLSQERETSKNRQSWCGY